VEEEEVSALVEVDAEVEVEDGEDFKIMKNKSFEYSCNGKKVKNYSNHHDASKTYKTS
jgi:hypothetical protein